METEYTHEAYGASERDWTGENTQGKEGDVDRDTYMMLYVEI
jgi:hypothetical protein